MALTPAAGATGHRSNGYYKVYRSSSGELVREGQVFWARYKSRGVAGFAICYILRMYSPPGGDQHDVLVDIIWGGNGGLMAGMEYQDTNKPRFELKNEPDVWTLFDGWFDTISADALSSPAPYKLVYNDEGEAPAIIPQLPDDDVVYLAGVGLVQERSHKLMQPITKLLPSTLWLQDLLAPTTRAMMQTLPNPRPHDGRIRALPCKLDRSVLGEISSGDDEGGLLKCGGSLEYGFYRAVMLTRRSDLTESKIFIPCGGNNTKI